MVTMFDSRVKTKCADKKEMQSSSMAQLKAARAEREPWEWKDQGGKSQPPC